MNAQSTNYLALTQTVSKNLGKMRADIPETMKGFNDMARAATQNGALDSKTKD